MKRVAGLLVAAVVILLLAPATALADAAIRIRSAETSPGQIHVVVAGSDLGTNVIDPAQVRVSLNGQDVKAAVTPLTAANAVVERSVFLAIDTSGSMQGPGIQGAKQAANAFLAAVPADVKVGLITFSEVPQIAVAPTKNRKALTDAVAALVAHGETALYDAISLAVKVLGPTGVRGIIVLSDGADTVSKTTLARTLTALSAARVRLDEVGFRTSAADSAVLGRIARGGGGTVLAASNAAGLAAVFQSAARDLSRELLVTVDVPNRLASTQATLRVQAAVAGRPLGDEIVTLLPVAATVTSQSSVPDAGPRPVATVHGWLGSKSSLWAGLAAVFLALLVALVVGLGRAGTEARSGARTRRLLSLYTLTGRPAKVAQESTALGDNNVARSAVELAGRFATRRGFDERLALKLDRAAIPLRVGEWLVICAGVAAAGLVLLGLLTGSFAVGLIAAIAGGVVPGRWLSFKARRRQAAFVETMPDSLQLVAGSLSAGFSLPQAIDSVAREGAEPLAGEFGRAVAESRLGVPIEDALESIADRMDSEDFRWVVMAVRVQREVGGNLAEVLGIVSQTMRDRASLRRQVRALSAEGRLSAYILIGMPILMAIFLVLFRRAYIRPLYTEALGLVMLGFAILLLVIGSFWMKKVVTVEV
ncbi:MAG: hypothetical protein NVS3B26_10160 [Mycobacteriales bacterium]